MLQKQNIVARFAEAVCSEGLAGAMRNAFPLKPVLGSV